MIYVSIDIETSGLDYEKNKVLSIGAIIEDTEKKLPFNECPKFNAIILQREITGSPRALTINADLISLIADYIESDDNRKEEIRNYEDRKMGGYKFYEEKEVITEFYHWLDENNFNQGLFDGGNYNVIKKGKLRPVIDGATKPITINAAGKNFGTFDKLFLQQLPWWQKLINVRQRILDPAILMVDWKKDKSLPPLSLCKERVGLDSKVTHNALEDAWDVIEILRKFY